MPHTKRNAAPGTDGASGSGSSNNRTIRITSRAPNGKCGDNTKLRTFTPRGPRPILEALLAVAMLTNSRLSTK